MMAMATKRLVLRRTKAGYYETAWVDDAGQRHHRTFGPTRGLALTRFGEFHANWQADWRVRNPSSEGPLTVGHRWELFDAHAQAYYRNAEGRPTGEARSIAGAMRPALELFAKSLAEEFGPKRLKVIQEALVEKGLCVNVVNQYIRKIRHVFRWLASEELISADVWHGLQTVAGLQAGRTRARTTEPVQPVPEADLWKVVATLPAVLQAMVQVQFYAGMRPGEVCDMRPLDVGREGRVWLYRPPRHKSRHRGRARVIALGPKAQGVLRPFLNRPEEVYLFSPRKAQAQRFARCQWRGRQPCPTPQTEHRLGDKYEAMTYARAISDACRRQGVTRWSPNQLRHNAATRLRREFGLDVAQVVLGHSWADVTQVYADVDVEKAAAAMEKVG